MKDFQACFHQYYAKSFLKLLWSSKSFENLLGCYFIAVGYHLIYFSIWLMQAGLLAVTIRVLLTNVTIEAITNAIITISAIAFKEVTITIESIITILITIAINIASFEVIITAIDSINYYFIITNAIVNFQFVKIIMNLCYYD